MGSFGKDLRMERLSRGIALEDITAVTKISRQHLEALEQEKFALLPGGILSKGIVRGYASAVGLNQRYWTERHDAAERRLRCIGAILLLLVVAAGVWLAVRYYGLRVGWWPTLLPTHQPTVHALLFRVLFQIDC
jgi:transcriptional regulator with XRE-family HTH domain